MKEKLISLISLILVCCGGEEKGDGVRGYAIYYKDDKGQDLLNPDTPQHFNADEVKVYDVSNINGTIIKNLGTTTYGFISSNNFLFKDNSGYYYIKFAPRPAMIFSGGNGNSGVIMNYTNGVEVNSTLVQLSQTYVDTLTYGHQFMAIPNPTPDTIFYQKKPVWVFSSSTISDPNVIYKMTMVVRR